MSAIRFLIKTNDINLSTELADFDQNAVVSRAMGGECLILLAIVARSIPAFFRILEIRAARIKSVEMTVGEDKVKLQGFSQKEAESIITKLDRSNDKQ